MLHWTPEYGDEQFRSAAEDTSVKPRTNKLASMLQGPGFVARHLHSFIRKLKRQETKSKLAQEAHRRNDDWIFLIHEINNKIIRMAADTRKAAFTSNYKNCIREQWQTHRPLKRILDCLKWPRRWKSERDGSYAWLDANGDNVNVTTETPNVLIAEQRFFENEIREFSECMIKYCRNWWW